MHGHFNSRCCYSWLYGCVCFDQVCESNINSNFHCCDSFYGLIVGIGQTYKFSKVVKSFILSLIGYIQSLY